MKILVPVDFSDITNAVLRTTKKIVEAHGGEVILFHAVSPIIYMPHAEGVSIDIIDVKLLQEIEATKKSEAMEKLASLKEFLKPVPVRAVAEVGDPRDLILEAEERENPDLLVIGSHKKGLVERILIGSTAEKIVKHSKKPVLTIKGAEPNLSGKVVVAYDFSKTAEDMVKFAIHFLKPFGAEVVLLHIDEPIELPVVEKIGRVIYQKYKQEKAKYLDKLKDRFSGEGFRITTRSVEGKDPAEGIIKCVEEENPDLLLMGSRGLSGLKRIFLGSTSTKVLREVEVPVLLHKEGKR